MLEAIKGDPALRDLPAIVTSSVEGFDNIVRCIEPGAEDYLSKPVNPVLLKARLSSSIEKKRLGDEQKVLLKRFATSEVAQDLQESGFALGGGGCMPRCCFATSADLLLCQRSRHPKKRSNF